MPFIADKAGPASLKPLLQGPNGAFHLSRCFGEDFVRLALGAGSLHEAVKELAAESIAVLDIPPQGDSLGQVRQRYGLAGVKAEALVLVRPDAWWGGGTASSLPLVRAIFKKKGLTR